MEDIVAHMNADHKEAVLDYARYYGRAPFHAESAQLTSFSTLNALDIEYSLAGKSNRVSISLVPPLESKAGLRPRLIAMAHVASITRVPALELANPPLSLTLFVLMVILGCVTILGGGSMSTWPFPVLWMSAERATNMLFGAHGRQVFYFASLIHVVEAAYCAHLTKSLTKKGGRGYGRVAGWSIQTLLCGFPALVLLLEKLDRTADDKNRVD
jgi:Protein of unknown function (DUF2470)/Domain of unknown function (DUF4499)